MPHYNDRDWALSIDPEQAKHSLFNAQSAAIQNLLHNTTKILRPYSSTPRLDAEILLAHVLGWTRARLLAERTMVLDSVQVTAFERFIARRVEQEPVAYIVGYREFYGLELLVDRRVLVPRPETELLVEQTLTVAMSMSVAPNQVPLCIADVGTGSGAIAVALAVHLPNARIYATDISTDALDVAAANVARHNVANQVVLLYGDLLTPVPEPVHLIVSNPPYTVLTAIDADVYRHQPHIALDGGIAGLDIYRRFLAQAPNWLRSGGAILLEIGATQGQAVCNLLHTVLPQAQVVTHRDLAGYDRIIAAQTFSP